MHHRSTMHGPSTWIRCPRRSFTAAICAAALALLPVATLRACDDEPESPDFDAVAERLLEAVADGELSFDHAEAMFAELARARFVELAEALEKEWDDEDEEEWEEEEEHRRRDDDLRRHREDLTRLRALERREARQESRGAFADRERIEWASQHLREVDCNERQVREVIELLPKLAQEFRTKGLMEKANREWVEHLHEELDLNEKQIERVLGIARRIAYLSRRAPEHSEEEAKKRSDDELHEHFRRLGVGDEALRRIHDHLLDLEFTPQQTRQSLGGIARTLHALRSGTKPEEIHERMEIHFRKEVGLNEKQFESVVELAHRLLPRLREHWQREREKNERKRRDREEHSEREHRREHDGEERDHDDDLR